MTDWMHNLAQPFFLEGSGNNNSELCLLIHGFTGSPAHLKELGELLNKEGYSVYAMVNAGHCTTPEEMEKTGNEEWLKKAREEYLSVKDKYERINLVGISMGGGLSLLLASEFQEINKVVIISAPIRFKNWMVHITPVVKFFMRFNPVQYPELMEGESDELDIGYDRTPVRCVPQLKKLMKRAEKALPKITCPIMVIQSDADGQVRSDSKDIIMNNVLSKEKKTLDLERAKHICTISIDKDRVHREIIDFIKD